MWWILLLENKIKIKDSYLFNCGILKMFNGNYSNLFLIYILRIF